MSTKFTYAVAMTISTAILNLGLYFTGFQTERLATGQYLQWIGFVIMGTVLFLGIKAVREEKPDRALSYGQGLGAGVLISLYAGLMTSVYIYIHFAFINPEFVDYQMQVVREQWEAAGLSDAQMDQAEGITRTMMGPVAQAIISPFAHVFVGLILSLVLAAVLKRKPAADAVPPPAAA
jgi:ABC-type sugar transport system permease subunit